MSSILTAAANLIKDREVVRIKSRKVGVQSLSRDGEDTIHRTLVPTVVKAITTDAALATAIMTVKAFAIADTSTTMETETDRLNRARAIQSLEELTAALGQPFNSVSLDSLRADSLRMLESSGLTAHKLLAVQARTVLSLAEKAHLGRIVANSPLAAKQLQEAQEAAAKAAAAKAEREAARAKAKAAAAGLNDVKLPAKPADRKALVAAWVASRKVA